MNGCSVNVMRTGGTRVLSSKRSLSWRGTEPLIKGNRINVLLCAAGAYGGLRLGRIETPHHLQISRLETLLLPCMHANVYVILVVGDLISNDESPGSEDRNEELNGIGKRRWLIFDPSETSSLRRSFAISNETTRT